jgi:hypothetical protein
MIFRAFRRSERGVRPSPRAYFPQLATAAACALALLGGCASDGQSEVLPPIVIGMSENTPPLVQSDEDAVFQVQTPVMLPMRAPTAEEAAKLAPTSPPYPREPWVKNEDTLIRIQYTLTNLTEQKQVVELLIDPWNEFTKYQPGFSVTEEGVLTDRSGYDKWVILEPKERLYGTITEDDVREMATDLATVMNIQAMNMDAMANLNAMFNHTFDLQNRSADKSLVPLIAPYIPTVVPGLVGFTLGIRKSGAPARIALEVVVDVQDLKRNRVLDPGSQLSANNQPLPEPTAILSPPAAPMN